MPRRRQYVPDRAPFEGDVVELRAGPLIAGGVCLSRLEDGRAVMLGYAAPGELVRASIERVHADYLEAVTSEVLEASPDRVEPRCPIFGECGGCQLQHLSYPAQLAAKEAIVREQLRRIGGLDDACVRPIVGAANPWAYRNNIRLSCGKKFGDAGFISRRGRGLLKVEHCDIAHPWVNSLLPKLQGKVAGLHQVQLRVSADASNYVVFPAIEELDLPTGQRSYVDTMGGRAFEVDLSAFFQVNHAQAEEMVRLCGEALPERGRLLVDAFAGVGTFAAIFANRFERVAAIEEQKSATERAKRNLKGTGAEVHTGKVEEVLPLLGLAPDAIILDPPRAGCHRTVLETIIATRPGVVVYVSCNPATLARDLRILVDGGFEVESVTPLDMFPQTGHIECVAKIVLADVAR